MQDALRTLQSNNITRKDVARFAGVTPALVTYYFPERNTLIEAATLPVVERLATNVRDWTSKNIEPGCILLNIIAEIMNCYSRDIAIIEQYISYRKSLYEEIPQDEYSQIYVSINGFFDKWLSSCVDTRYDGVFMTNVLLGICRSVARDQLYIFSRIVEQAEQQRMILTHSEMIYGIIIGVLPVLTAVDARSTCRLGDEGIVWPTLDRSAGTICSGAVA